MIIDTGEWVGVGEDTEVVFVSLAEPSNGINFMRGVSCFGAPAIFMGDAGIRPYNYDNRATQVFTTKEELVAAMEMWNGRNPNFVTEDGDSTERDWEPDSAHYDYYEED